MQTGEEADADVVGSFSGVVGRCVIQGDVAHLRFYPFTFSLEESPVFEVHCSNVCLSDSDVEGSLGQEADVDVFKDWVAINLYWDTDIVLRAGAVSCGRAPYDRDDLIGYVRRAETEVDHLHRQLRKSELAANRVTKLVEELLRRAETKAAASDTLRERQAAAIAVLERVLHGLKETD
jgi:hypothetical protein